MTEPAPRPVVRGFTVEWDPIQQEWLARSPSGYQVRGRTQHELNRHRWALYEQALAQFRSAIAELYPLQPR